MSPGRFHAAPWRWLFPLVLAYPTVWLGVLGGDWAGGVTLVGVVGLMVELERV